MGATDSSATVNNSAPPPASAPQKRCIKEEERWDGVNRFLCTPLNKTGTPRDQMTGVISKCTYDKVCVQYEGECNKIKKWDGERKAFTCTPLPIGAKRGYPYDKLSGIKGGCTYYEECEKPGDEELDATAINEAQQVNNTQIANAEPAAQVNTIEETSVTYKVQPTTTDPSLKTKGVEVPTNNVNVYNENVLLESSLYDKFETPNVNIPSIVDVTVEHAPNSPGMYNVGGNVHIKVSLDKNVNQPNYVRNILNIGNKGVIDVMLKFITDPNFVVSNYELSQANELGGVPSYIQKPNNSVNLVNILSDMKTKNNNTLGWNLNYNRDLSETDVTRICSFFINKMNALIHYVITNNVTQANDTVRNLVNTMFRDNSGNIYSFAHFTLVLPALVNYFAKPNINGVDNHALKYVGYIKKDSRILPTVTGNYQTETKHVERPKETAMKFDTRADYLFKKENEYLMKTGQYNYPFSINESNNKWNAKSVKDVPVTNDVLNGIDIPFVKTVNKDPYKWIKANNDFKVITQSHLSNFPEKSFGYTYRQLSDDVIKTIYDHKSETVSCTVPAWSNPSYKCKCRNVEVWDGNNRFGCTPLNRGGTEKDKLSGITSRCTYKTEERDCQICGGESGGGNTIETTLKNPMINENANGVQSRFNPDNDTVAITVSNACGTNNYNKTLSVVRKFEFNQEPRDNPAHFVGFCKNKNECGPNVGIAVDRSTMTFTRTENNPLGVNAYKPREDWGYKPYVAQRNDKVYGEFNLEGGIVDKNEDETNFKYHQFLTTYNIENDILYFNDNVFNGWLDLVLSKPALQTIVNDIRKLAIENPSLIVLCNTFNHMKKYVDDKLKGSTTVVELPLGPPLLNVGSDFMLDNKYIYGCAAKGVIDARYGKFEESKQFTPLINKYMVNEQVTGYKKSSYLDYVYRHLYEICKLPSNLSMSDPKQRKHAIAISIPSSGTQIFDVIDNKYSANDKTAFGGSSNYVSYMSWDDLAKAGNRAMLLIFFSDPSVAGSGGEMLTGLYDKVGEGEFNVSMFNVEYANKLNIDIDTRNGDKATTNNKVWLYATKSGGNVFYKCTTGTKKHNDKTNKYVVFDYFGPDMQSLPAFLRNKKYEI